MKKLLLIIIVSGGFTAWAQTPAQPWGSIPNPSVFDIKRYYQLVKNGMDMYEQLTGLYQTIKTNVEKLEEQRKDFEALNTIMTYGNRMKTYEENIETILNRKDIKIGKVSYSLADLYTAKPAEKFMDSFEKFLTDDEIEIFIKKYGISYGHYARNFIIQEGLAQKAAEVIAYNEKLREELAVDREAIQSMVKNPGDRSWVKEQQKINGLLLEKSQDLKTKTKLITDISAMYAGIAAEAKLESEALQKSCEADLGENYLKILEKTGNKNNFMGHLYPFN